MTSYYFYILFISVLYEFLSLTIILLFVTLMMSSNLLLSDTQLEQGYDNMLEEINLDEMTISSQMIPEDTMPPVAPKIKTIDLDTDNQTTPKHSPNTPNQSEEKKMKKKVVKKTQAKCKYLTYKVIIQFITAVVVVVFFRILFQPFYIIFKCLSDMILEKDKTRKRRKH